MKPFKFLDPRILAVVLAAGLLALLPGCGPAGDGGADGAGGKSAASPGAAPGAEKVEKGEKAEPAAPSGAVVTVDPATAATVTGTVSFSGKEPQKVPIMMAADRNCAAMHTAPVYPDDVVVNDNKTLRWVFVSLSGANVDGKTFPVPAEPVVFDQRGCRYEPHVFGIMAKQKLDILNSDATNHNVHSQPKKNRDFNRGMPTKGMRITESFPRPEAAVKIKCEVHNWMGAWCHVMTHPYFSVTNDKGEFKISNVPPGKYTVTAWHEKYGEKKLENIEVAAKETKDVDFEYKGE